MWTFASLILRKVRARQAQLNKISKQLQERGKQLDGRGFHQQQLAQLQREEQVQPEDEAALAGPAGDRGADDQQSLSQRLQEHQLGKVPNPGRQHSQDSTNS